MKTFLQEVRKRATIGFVGGSDLPKQQEQLGKDVLAQFDFGFPENGVLAYKDAKLVASSSIKTYLGEEKIKTFINFVLHYIADLDIPKKRGTFVEFRTSMINISPIGRNCSQEERIEFFEYDKTHHVRETMVKKLREQFKDYNLQFSIGGQISIDVFPAGWDKTYCLRHVESLGFKEIHFFGDRTEEKEICKLIGTLSDETNDSSEIIQILSRRDTNPSGSMYNSYTAIPRVHNPFSKNDTIFDNIFGDDPFSK